MLGPALYTLSMIRGPVTPRETWWLYLSVSASRTRSSPVFSAQKMSRFGSCSQRTARASQSAFQVFAFFAFFAVFARFARGFAWAGAGAGAAAALRSVGAMRFFFLAGSAAPPGASTRSPSSPGSKRANDR